MTNVITEPSPIFYTSREAGVMKPGSHSNQLRPYPPPLKKEIQTQYGSNNLNKSYFMRGLVNINYMQCALLQKLLFVQTLSHSPIIHD
jgi:hypothetical protein